MQDNAYFQVRGQRLESDGSKVTDSPTAKDASFDQMGYSAKGGIEDTLYGLSAEIGESKGTSQYDLFGAPAFSRFFKPNF